MLFCLFLFLTNVISQNIQSRIGIVLSSIAYCGKDEYNKISFSGILDGFSVYNILHDRKTDMQGYIGILDSTKSIYVVLRGTDSRLNIINDLKFKKTKYLDRACNCYVHTGFYEISNRIKDTIISNIKNIKKKYNNYDVILTAHSLGAAVHSLLILELYKVNISAFLYNYGQPRVGDKNFARFFNNKIKNYYRYTHYKDIIPHIPPININYYHSCGEIYEDENGRFKNCSKTNCEDSTCSEQFNLVETNVPDHLFYFNQSVSCQNSLNYKIKSIF